MRKALITALFLAFAGLAMASDGDDLTSLSYISYLERYATIQPANQNESLEAVINMPLVAGDRVDTAREARMEVVLSDGNTLWLDEYTTMSLDAVAFSRDAEAERTVVFLAEGALIFEVSAHALPSRPVRIDGRGATVYLESEGLYRIQALASGDLRVEVMAGLAEVATNAGGVLVRAESSAEVGGGEILRSEPILSWNDDFAVWVEMRRQIAAGESSQYVDLRYSRQAAQLDSYGSWVYVDSMNSWAWQPTVGGSWQPYTAGRWYWTSTGYAWISYEPWGWLPYHYGSWYHDVGYGWVWSWGRYWGPAWVNWIWWPGYVGWCPYGYYDYWYGGYYPPYNPGYPGHPGHPGGGGGAHGQPPRRDVMPTKRASSGRLSVGTDGGAAGAKGATSRPALDLNGRVRVASVDRKGWTVVSQDDFTSPHLTRLAKPGARLMPSSGDQMGVVMTGPLTTRSPSSANPRAEIERVFRGVESRRTADLSPLLARDTSLSPRDAQRLGQPTTVAEISRRSTEAAAANRGSVSPHLSAVEGSPFHRSGPSTRSQPNLYRPTIYTGTATGSSAGVGPRSSGSSSGGRQLVAPRTSAGRSSGSTPLIIPRTSSTGYGGPRSSTGTASRSPGRAPSSPSVRSPSSGRSSSSVRSPSSGRSSPGARSSSVSRSSPSRSSSAGSSRSSGASRPSGSSSGGSKGAVPKK
jgi:hypothetical protein